MDGPAPQKRARSEVYGFVSWTVSWVFLVAYILWAFVPDSVWHPLGVHYYPNRYWAYAVPIYLFLLWIFTVVVYFGYNLMNTESLASFYTITDEKANDEGETLSLKDPNQIVPIADVPITLVNELLYQNPRDSGRMADQLPRVDSSSSLLNTPQNGTLLMRHKRRDHVRQLTT